MKVFLIALRVFLGAVFVYAAYVKLKAPWYMFAANIYSYQMLPSWVSEYIARTLPAFELVLGLVLISGFKLRWSALISGLLLLAFWLSMAVAYSKGLAINCGCFGDGEPLSKLTLLRDGLLVIAAGLLWRFSSPRANTARAIDSPVSVA